jgi:hypothetical protein
LTPFAGKGTQLAPNGVNGTSPADMTPYGLAGNINMRSQYYQFQQNLNRSGLRGGSALPPSESKGFDDYESEDVVDPKFQPTENVDGFGNGDLHQEEREARQKAAHLAFTLQAAQA